MNAPIGIVATLATEFYEYREEIRKDIKEYKKGNHTYSEFFNKFPEFLKDNITDEELDDLIDKFVKLNDYVVEYDLEASYAVHIMIIKINDTYYESRYYETPYYNNEERYGGKCNFIEIEDYDGINILVTLDHINKYYDSEEDAIIDILFKNVSIEDANKYPYKEFISKCYRPYQNLRMYRVYNNAIHEFKFSDYIIQRALRTWYKQRTHTDYIFIY